MNRSGSIDSEQKASNQILKLSDRSFTRTLLLSEEINVYKNSNNKVEFVVPKRYQVEFTSNLPIVNRDEFIKEFLLEATITQTTGDVIFSETGIFYSLNVYDDFLRFMFAHINLETATPDSSFHPLFDAPKDFLGASISFYIQRKDCNE